jgi:hypothetical protein
VVGLGQAGDSVGSGRERDTVPGVAGLGRQRGRKVGFAGAGGSEKDHVLLGGDEIQRPHVSDLTRLMPVAWVKSNSSNNLWAGNRAALTLSSPSWAARAVTSRSRQAGSQDLIMALAIGAGPFGAEAVVLAGIRPAARPVPGAGP